MRTRSQKSRHSFPSTPCHCIHILATSADNDLLCGGLMTFYAENYIPTVYADKRRVWLRSECQSAISHSSHFSSSVKTQKQSECSSAVPFRQTIFMPETRRNKSCNCPHLGGNYAYMEMRDEVQYKEHNCSRKIWSRARKKRLEICSTNSLFLRRLWPTF